MILIEIFDGVGSSAGPVALRPARPFSPPRCRQITAHELLREAATHDLVIVEDDIFS